MTVQAPSTDHPRSVTVLGATGSIGLSTLDLIEADPDCYDIVALTAHRNVDALARLARLHRAKLAVIADPAGYPALKEALEGSGTEVACGPEGLVQAASLPAEWVMAAIVGAAGLPPTLAAVQRGAMVALATKEALVAAGSLFMEQVKAHGATLLPVDSEHNAIFQALKGECGTSIERLILTASGGPFWRATQDVMAAATPAIALKHPNWEMGAKISIDSATMMNKGLELIEAHHLFAMDEERLDVLVHTQSIIHSLVSFRDGSTLAQLGQPDMRIPIAYILGWPERIEVKTPRLDLAEIGKLTFEPPDLERYPALRLARDVMRTGGQAANVMNAANEIAVAAFLDQKIGFLDIAAHVEATVEMIPTSELVDLEQIIAIDQEARMRCAELINRQYLS